MSTPAATAAFSDSAPPSIGTPTRQSHSAMTCSLTPSASLPMTKARSPAAARAYASPKQLPPAPGAAAHIAKPPAFSSGSQSRRLTPVATGTRKAEPIAALSVLGEYRSTQPSDIATPENPAASAVLIIVPALPGSLTRSMTSIPAKPPRPGASSPSRPGASSPA